MMFIAIRLYTHALIRRDVPAETIGPFSSREEAEAYTSGHEVRGNYWLILDVVPPESIEQLCELALDATAHRFREWIHGQPSLTRCDVGSDTCPDWSLAYELAHLAVDPLLDVLVAERGLADQLAERFEDVSTWVSVGSPAYERIQAALALYRQTRGDHGPQDRTET